MKIAFFFTLLFNTILQACSFQLPETSNGAGSDTTISQIIKKKFSPYARSEKRNSKVNFRSFSKKGMQVYAYLILNEAMSVNDYRTVLQASFELLTLDPNAQVIADTASYLISNGLIDEAEKYLKNASKKLPNDLTIHVMLSEALVLQNNKEKEAINVLKSFSDRNPDNHIAKMELALAYLKANESQKAYMAFSGLPKTEKTPTVLYYTAISLKRLNKLDEAAHLLKEALKASPDFLELSLELAQIEEKRGNFTEARKNYEKIIEVDAYNQDILLKLAIIAIREDNIPKALELTKNAEDSFSFIVGISSFLVDEKRADLADKFLIELAKNYHEDVNDLNYLHGALAYEGLKDNKKSLSYLIKINPSDQHYQKALEIMTQIYLENDDLNEALNTLKIAIEKYPDNISYYNFIAQIYIYQEEYALALPFLQKFITENPGDSEAAFHYAYIHSKIGDVEKSLKLMEDILKIEPENYDVLNFIGYTLVERQQKLQYALKLIKKAYELQPNTGYITDSLAWAYYQLKDYEKAWEYISKAITLVTKEEYQDPTLWEHYGDIAFSLGKIEEAKKGWQRSLDIKKSDAVLKKLNNL